MTHRATIIRLGRTRVRIESLLRDEIRYRFGNNAIRSSFETRSLYPPRCSNNRQFRNCCPSVGRTLFIHENRYLASFHLTSLSEIFFLHFPKLKLLFQARERSIKIPYIRLPLEELWETNHSPRNTASTRRNFASITIARPIISRIKHSASAKVLNKSRGGRECEAGR